MENQITSFQKFRLLLWKNFLLEWNQKIALVLEIIVPVMFGIMILFFRILMTPSKQHERRYPPVQIDDLSELWDNTENVPRILAYSPENPYLDNVIKDASESLTLDSYKAFANSKELANAISETNFTAAVQFADVFAHLSNYPQKFEFELRFPSVLRNAPYWGKKHPRESIWPTDSLRNPHPLAMPYEMEAADGGVPPGYLREGFVQVQHAITMSYIKLATSNAELPQIVMRRTPYPPFVHDFFLNFILELLPFLLGLGFMASSITIARYIAQEKEKQLKEVMKIMGVPNWIHWLAWFVRSFLILSLVSVLFVLILKVPMTQDVSIFNKSDWTVLLLFFLVWSTSIICFSFMMAVFFDQASTAAGMTGLIYFLTLAPLYFVYSSYNSMHFLMKLLVCLNFNFAQAIATSHIIYMEGIGEGAQWSNLSKALSEDDSLSLGFVMLMMIIAAILYMIVCLYLEQVWPGRIGIPKKWYFPFKRDFWYGEKKEREFEWRKSMTIDRDYAEVFEEEPKNARVGVEVKALGKRFDDKWVVRDLSLNMIEDEITVLLGHNGAGKTTIISMLTGMIPPTTGTAIINGCDIRTSIDGARASMGVCPQHNVLFDDMSVANHLIFFTKLKGIRGRAVKIEVERFLEIIQLKQQANELPTTLSGGMKRKLSLCCALCGDSKVVFCDEPSCGMDPAARRQLWDLLQSEKIGRTVLLTTHFMDEADVLGDRIAIMSNGELKCHGTSFFLKKKFGSGYHLICVKKENADVDGLTNLLGRYIPGITPESDIGSELTYRLPEQYLYIFGEMLQELENNIERLGFTEFGIGVTSLEEVFLKVGAENADPNVLNQIRSSSFSAPSSELATGSKSVKPKTESSGERKSAILKKGKQLEMFGEQSKSPRSLPNITPNRKQQNYVKQKLPKIRGEENVRAGIKFNSDEENINAELPKRRFKKRDLKRRSSYVSSSEEDVDPNTRKRLYDMKKKATESFKNPSQESLNAELHKDELRSKRPIQTMSSHSSVKGKVTFGEESDLNAPFVKLESLEESKLIICPKE